MRIAWLLPLALSLMSPHAWPHGDTHTGKSQKSTSSSEEKSFGREGDPKSVSRTIKIDMTDAMRYSPAEIAIKRGETIRFQASNSGKVVHEIVLGTMRELKEHAELMKKHPGMEHDEPIWRT